MRLEQENYSRTQKGWEKANLMNEDIGLVVIAGDETKPLRDVEPLHCPLETGRCSNGRDKGAQMR